MLFYGNYENEKRYICAYDEEKHGSPRVVSDDLTFIYHNSVSVNRVYKTEQEAMTEKQVEKFYNACPSGYGVEETRVFDLLSLQYITVSMRYIKLF